jgi:hypothetical protein
MFAASSVRPSAGVAGNVAFGSSDPLTGRHPNDRNRRILLKN